MSNSTGGQGSSGESELGNGGGMRSQGQIMKSRAEVGGGDGKWQWMGREGWSEES